MRVDGQIKLQRQRFLHCSFWKKMVSEQRFLRVKAPQTLILRVVNQDAVMTAILAERSKNCCIGHTWWASVDTWVHTKLCGVIDGCLQTKESNVVARMNSLNNNLPSTIGTHVINCVWRLARVFHTDEDLEDPDARAVPLDVTEDDEDPKGLLGIFD